MKIVVTVLSVKVVFVLAIHSRISYSAEDMNSSWSHFAIDTIAGLFVTWEPSICHIGPVPFKCHWHLPQVLRNERLLKGSEVHGRSHVA